MLQIISLFGWADFAAQIEKMETESKNKTCCEIQIFYLKNCSLLFFQFQLPERAMFQIKQHNPNGNGVSEWQLEEAQVFWAKKEESLALNILKTMIKKLDADWFQVCVT